MNRIALGSFSLVRYFASVSLVCIALAAIALGWYYRELSIRDLTSLAEERNGAIARLLANSAWPSLRDARGGEELRETLARQLRDTPVVKVKAYDRDGRTIFSTEARQVGEDKGENSGVRSALHGRPSSELTYRDSFSAFEGVIEDRNLLSTYVPIRAADGAVEGVFEVYYDVTGIVEQIGSTQLLISLGVGVVLLLLYGALFVVVSDAQRVIDVQEAKLREQLAIIDAQRKDLDQRVQERTREIAEAYRMLLLESTRHRHEPPLR